MRGGRIIAVTEDFSMWGPTSDKSLNNYRQAQYRAADLLPRWAIGLLVLLAALFARPGYPAPIEFHFGDQDWAELRGPWEFYWEQFIDPEVVRLSGLPEPTAMVELPGSWIRVSGAQGPLPAVGYGSYRIVLSLDHADNRELVLLIPMIYSAYKLFVNGELAAQVGEVGKSPDTSRPDYGERRVPILPVGGKVELIIQVSNFSSRIAGFPFPVEIGTAEAIAQTIYMKLIAKAALAGGAILIGLSKLMVFFLRRELMYLFFGLFVTAGGVHVIISQQLLDYAGWHIPVAAARLLDGTTLLAAGILYLLFLSSLFPKHFPMRVVRWAPLLLVIYLIAAAVVPSMVRSQLIGWLFYIVIGAIGLSLLAVGRAWRERTPDAGLILISSAGIAATGCLQAIVFNESGIRDAIVDLAALVTIALYNIILARRYSRAFERSQRLESALRRASHLKDEFLANTSHELRTPLHAMVGLAESLPRDNKVLARGLDLIAASGHRLGRLVDDILAFTRLKYNDLSLTPQHLHLEPIVHSVLDVCRPLVSTRPVTLQFEMETGLPAVQADPDRLHQVLFNLVGNAIKFTDNGSVTVRVCRQNDKVVLHVIDTGIGLPAEDWERLLSPYEQGSESSLEGRGGLGLGLAISRRIVALHGSELKLETTLGRGTHIYFELPVAQSYAPETLAKTERPLSSVDFLSSSEQGIPTTTGVAERPAQILVVDDEDSSAQVLETQLSLAGYQTIRAESGRAALSAIKRFRPDLVMLDVMMPDMSGLTVCRHIREEYDVNTLPVILVTARSRPEDAVQGLDAGANDYLAKPFWRQEMLARVAAQLRIRDNEQMRWALNEERARTESSAAADPRDLLVELLKKSVQYWEMQTGKSRADLAEASGLWTVTLDGSTRKTRTLDRYLNLKTLPKRPRWGNVTRTARYVIERLESQSQIGDLRALLEQLEAALGA